MEQRIPRSYLGGAGGRVGELVQRACARVPQRALCFSELHPRRLRELDLRGPITVLRGLYAGGKRAPSPRAGGIVPASERYNRWPAAREPDNPVVLFAGRLIPEKRVTVGVAAVARAARRIEGLRGVFYGEGPEREALHAAIAEHDASAFVSAPGFGESERVDADMSRALCVLLPSDGRATAWWSSRPPLDGTPRVVVAAPDNAAVELVEAGVNGVIASRPTPRRSPTRSCVCTRRARRCARARPVGLPRVPRLSLEGSLRAVLDSYALNARP